MTSRTLVPLALATGLAALALPDRANACSAARGGGCDWYGYASASVFGGMALGIAGAPALAADVGIAVHLARSGRVPRSWSIFGLVGWSINTINATWMLTGLIALPPAWEPAWGYVGGYLGFSAASLAFSIVAFLRPPIAFPPDARRNDVRLMFTGNGVMGTF